MDSSKEPHLISIKVLRLSRPSIAEQTPIPEPLEGDLNSLDPRASRSHPQAVDRDFSLSPLLSLPTGFGTAFVGSTFSCTICANNELSDDTETSISSVKISAEISTPSQSVVLTLSPEDAEGDATAAATQGLKPRQTEQKLLSFDLREEGSHTLAVNVSYEVTSHDGSTGSVMGRRMRVFRKLYQFNAVPCLSVRTKATDLLTPQAMSARNAKQALERAGESFALEAQLENLTNGPITLEKVTFNPKAPYTSTSLNWEDPVYDGPEAKDRVAHLTAPTLNPRAVYQVCHVISESEDESVSTEQKEMTKDGRIILGTLSIKWRGPMGDPGILSTGWLTSKRR